tara:strand:- start:65 stop:388 length:324 start_codon:yes stop_codon:yes gene_type:complete
MITLKEYNEVKGKKVVFTEDGFDKGVAYIIMWKREGCNKLVASIQDVMVKEEFRGSGIGSELIKRIITYCKSNIKIYKIILECSNENIDFYKKFGFRLHENHMRLDV